MKENNLVDLRLDVVMLVVRCLVKNLGRFGKDLVDVLQDLKVKRKDSIPHPP